MRPERIILVRHGESEGNLDKRVYTTKPDFALNLTKKGRKQADKCGQMLKQLMEHQSVLFYRSPFYRTRQTHEEIAKYFPGAKLYEDPRLREQEHTPRLIKGHRNDVSEERDTYSHFYYRFEGGESCADVFDRVSDFLATLYRDFNKENFPKNCVIVSHGMTNRVFLMRLLHFTVEQFEFLKNPRNCGFYILARQESGKYELTEEPEKYPKRRCLY
jgi:broad specificity phosphatase PhoE